MEKIDVRHKIHTVPMMRYAAVLILGVFVGDALGDVVKAWMWLVMMALLTGSAYLLNKKRGLVSSMCILGAVVCVGGFRICYSQIGEYGNNGENGEIVDAGQDGRRMFGVEKEKVGCEIIVLSEPKGRGKVLQFDCLVCESEFAEARRWKMRVSMLRDEHTGRYKSVRLGDALKAQVDMTPLHDWHRRNKHFDYLRWLRTRGFRCNAFIGIDKWEHVERDWSKVGMMDEMKIRALMVRDKVLERFRGNMKGEAYSIATAMTLGNKGAVSSEMYEEYSMGGASHVLALSGMHLAIIYMLLTFVLKRDRVWKRMVLLAFVWTYVFFVGLPISMIRAAAMLTLWEVIDMVDYEQKPLNILCMTGFGMIMINPACVWDVGFELSFMAVMSILVFADVARRCTPRMLMRKSEKEWRRLPKWLRWCRWPLATVWQAMTISVAAQVGTMPLVAYYFGRVSVYFLLTNVIVVVFATGIVCMTLMMVVVSGFDMMVGIEGGMGSFLLGGALERIVWVFDRGVMWVAHLPGASIEGVEVNGVQVLAVYGIVGVMGFWANRGGDN